MGNVKILYITAWSGEGGRQLGNVALENGVRHSPILVDSRLRIKLLGFGGEGGNWETLLKRMRQLENITTCSLRVQSFTIRNGLHP